MSRLSRCHGATSIWFLGGLQMFCIGIVGTYVGKIYAEVKGRPRYRIEKEIINGYIEDNNTIKK